MMALAGNFRNAFRVFAPSATVIVFSRWNARTTCMFAFLDLVHKFLQIFRDKYPLFKLGCVFLIAWRERQQSYFQ